MHNFYGVCSMSSLTARTQGLWNLRMLQPFVHKLITQIFKFLIIRGFVNISKSLHRRLLAAKMLKKCGDVKTMLRHPISNHEKEHNKYFDNEFPLESSHHVQNLSPPETYAFRNLVLEGDFRYHPNGHLHWRARDGNVPLFSLSLHGGWDWVGNCRFRQTPQIRAEINEQPHRDPMIPPPPPPTAQSSFMWQWW